MKTRNAMQLKALINNRAKAAGVSPQLMLQNYMLERLIDRISRSSWRDCIIVKGGMLIGSLIGVDRRTTKDLDTTVRGFTLTHSKAAEVFGEICAIDAEDDLSFELLRTDDIREADEYPGIRVFLRACYDPLAVPLTVDVFNRPSEKDAFRRLYGNRRTHQEVPQDAGSYPKRARGEVRLDGFGDKELRARQ